MYKLPEFYDVGKEVELKLNLHKRKCHEFFDDIKKGGLLYVSIEVNNSMLDNFKEPQYVRVSLVTNDMLEYDLTMFQNMENMKKEEIINFYRPYYWMRLCQTKII